ncbi:hypothetical protein LP420_12570 [Massilia sp. B-10]|nr:hypothetical protein LP420_12570 [Massilia sp. B-10]
MLNLLAVEAQGRHRYFRLADDDVAHLLESLMGVASRCRSGAIAQQPARTGHAPRPRVLRPSGRGTGRVRVRQSALRARRWRWVPTGWN